MHKSKWEECGCFCELTISAVALEGVVGIFPDSSKENVDVGAVRLPRSLCNGDKNPRPPETAINCVQQRICPGGLCSH